MKRFGALLAALMMLAGCAFGQEISTGAIASYSLPKGAEALHIWDSVLWEAPEGLDGMYQLMRNAVLYGDVYLVRMPNGRALVSVSCMKPERQYTAQELLALWPQIARNIAKEGVWTDASESCARADNLYGFDVLHIETTIGMETASAALTLDAEGIAFPRGEELIEVWAVAPAADTYAADDPAAQELADDLVSMDMFLQSLDFSGLNSRAVEGYPYVDPDGRFALLLPVGCTVLTRHSSQEDIDQARQSYLAAHSPGAELLFEEYLSDLTTLNVTVILSEDRQVAVELFASQEESFRGATAEQLMTLAQPIQKSLSEKFDAVLALAEAEQAVISGARHAWLTYWVRSGEADVQLDVMASVLDDAWLYEVDLYTHDGDQELRKLWYTLLTQTLQYTPLTNALGD